MKAGRATKILLSVLIIGAYLLLMYLGLAVILTYIAGWYVWVFVFIILGFLCLRIFILINWIWKGDMETSDPNVYNRHNRDNTLRKIFLTIGMLISFLGPFFISVVMVQAFIGTWVLFIVVIIMLYVLYSSVKWIWKTQ